MDYNIGSTLAREHSCSDALQSHSKNLNVPTVETVGFPVQNSIVHSSLNTAQVSKTVLSQYKQWEACCSKVMGVYVFKVNRHKWDVFCNSSYSLVIMLAITLGVPLEIQRRGWTGLLTSSVSVKSDGHPDWNWLLAISS